MILFCDTSALVKLYIAEPGSKALKRHITKSEVIAVCRVAWAEAHAALSRRARGVPRDSRVTDRAKALLADDWPRFLVMQANQPVVERAGEYADMFAPRGIDSIQLASAFEVGRISGSQILFASYDTRLNKAARQPGSWECNVVDGACGGRWRRQSTHLRNILSDSSHRFSLVDRLTAKLPKPLQNTHVLSHRRPAHIEDAGKLGI